MEETTMKKKKPETSSGSGLSAPRRNFFKMSEKQKVDHLEKAHRDRELAEDLVVQVPAIVKMFGDVAGRALDAWLDRIGREGEIHRAATAADVARLRKKLEGSEPTPLERLLIDRIVLAWLQANYFDLREAMAIDDKHSSVAHLALGVKRQDRAHRRYLYALRQLAEVRRLQTPSVQVNVAQQQLNVGAGDVAKVALPSTITSHATISRDVTKR